MKRQTLLAVAVAAAALVPASLLAHRQWMLPSSTVLSKADTWITVDAAISNELFFFDHVPMRPNNLVITAPDGSTIQPQNVATGKYRTTFDVHLQKPGTYRIASVSNTVFANWSEQGQPKSWRGDAAALTTAVPAGAQDLKTSRMNNRIEFFVTAGKPDTKALEPAGAGLELAAITHPNDLVAGEPAQFRFLHNGKPAANLEVTVIPGGIRYRDQLHEQKITTDGEGKFTVRFAQPGMYWLNATVGGGQRGPGGPGEMPAGDRAGYVATLEVMPE